MRFADAKVKRESYWPHLRSRACIYSCIDEFEFHLSPHSFLLSTLKQHVSHLPSFAPCMLCPALSATIQTAPATSAIVHCASRAGEESILLLRVVRNRIQNSASAHDRMLLSVEQRLPGTTQHLALQAALRVRKGN